MHDDVVTKQDLLDFEGRINVHFAKFTKQLTVLGETMDGGFDSVDTRFDDLEARFDDLEARMSSIELKMDGLEVKQSVLHRGIADVEERLDKVEGHLIAIEADVKDLYRLNKQTRQMFGARLKAHLVHEQRLQKLEAFAESAAKRVGLKLP